jgi:hypothetical protein
LNEPQPAACSGAEGGRATSSEANDIEMTGAERQQIKRSPQEWGRISAGLTNEKLLETQQKINLL